MNKNDFQHGGHSPSWILKIFILNHPIVIELWMCSRVSNFIKIGWSIVEIWRFYDLQYGGRPPSWIFEIYSFYHPAILLRYAKFHWNRTIGCWVMAKKLFSKWRLSAILNFRGKIMGSLKSTCSTIETIALNCLLFEQIAFLYAFWWQTDIRTDRRTQYKGALALAVASGALVIIIIWKAMREAVAALEKASIRLLTLIYVGQIFTARCSV